MQIITTYNNIIDRRADHSGRAVRGSFAGITGSNPAGHMDVYLLRVWCVLRQRSLIRAHHSTRGVILSVVCLSVIVMPR